jgi:outer membrane protein TolC
MPLSAPSASGGASAQQSSAAAGTATINSSVQVSGAFAGSVPGDNVPAGPIHLTISEAVKRGLEANLGPISANNEARVARAQRLQALSALLPNLAAAASNTVTQVNLAAYGFQFKTPPGFAFSIPTVVGPYNYSQLTGTLSQSVYDPVQIRNWRSSKASERASVLSAKDARETVVLAVAGSYLQTVATAARIASQKAEVENAQAIYNQAQVRKAAGTNARIDVTRSQVELQTEEQRLSSLEADYRKQLIALARLIGLPQDRELVLSENLSPNLPPLPVAEETIREAWNKRADLDAAAAQIRAAELALSAARAERLPSVSLSGDYGVMGPNPASTHGVFSVTGTVNVPIWQGGRTSADIDQAQTTLHQHQAEFADLRSRVEQEVRDAWIEYQTAIGQVKLAENNQGLARDTLAQARDRFAAGVANTVEVVQAQQQVASAESDYISSLFSLNLANLSLQRATGKVETSILSPANTSNNGVRP